MEFLERLTDEFLIIYDKSPTRLKNKLSSTINDFTNSARPVCISIERMVMDEWWTKSWQYWIGVLCVLFTFLLQSDSHSSGSQHRSSSHHRSSSSSHHQMKQQSSSSTSSSMHSSSQCNLHFVYNKCSVWTLSLIPNCLSLNFQREDIIGMKEIVTHHQIDQQMYRQDHQTVRMVRYQPHVAPVIVSSWRHSNEWPSILWPFCLFFVVFVGFFIPAVRPQSISSREMQRNVDSTGHHRSSSSSSSSHHQQMKQRPTSMSSSSMYLINFDKFDLIRQRLKS